MTVSPGYRSLFQFSFFFVAWCLLLEVLVRLFLMSPSDIVDDSVLGWRYPSNSTFVTQTEAGSRTVSTNEFGLNNVTIGPKDGRARFVVLGDSYVEAFQVARSANFMSLVMSDLPRFELINAGRSGFDPAMELAQLDRLGAALAPDGVIMVINGGDEKDMLTSGLKVKRCVGSVAVCDFQLPVQVVGGVKELLRGPMARSALLTYLLRKYRDPIGQEISEVRRYLRTYGRAGGGGVASAEVYDGWEAPTSSDIEGLLQLVFSRIGRVYHLIVVLIPPIEFNADRNTEMIGSKTFAANAERAAHAAGVVFLDAFPALADAYRKTGTPPLGFSADIVGSGHLNVLGHRALASALEELLVSTPAPAGR